LIDDDFLLRCLPPPVFRRGDFGGGRVVEQILGQTALFSGDRSEPFQLLRVDDRQVQSGLGAVVQENGVDHFTGRRRQTQRDVRDSQDRLHVWNALFNEPNSLDRLDRATYVVRVARRAGEDQRIEHDILGRDAVLFCQKLVRALRDRQLALSRERLRLLLVFI